MRREEIKEMLIRKYSENHLNLKTVPVCRLPHKNGDSPEILLKTFKMTSI